MLGSPLVDLFARRFRWYECVCVCVLVGMSVHLSVCLLACLLLYLYEGNLSTLATIFRKGLAQNLLAFCVNHTMTWYDLA